MKTTKLTAEQEYAKLLEQQFENWLDSTFSAPSLKGVELYEHKCPTGLTFKVRNVTQEFLIQSGGTPTPFLNDHVMAEGDAKDVLDDPKKAEEAFRKMSPQQKASSIAMLSKAMRYMCVEPRIVLESNGQSNCIPAAMISIGDYNSLAEVVGKSFTGGGAALGLKTFRKKRR